MWGQSFRAVICPPAAFSFPSDPRCEHDSAHRPACFQTVEKASEAHCDSAGPHHEEEFSRFEEMTHLQHCEVLFSDN